jgi:hypothetical protein
MVRITMAADLRLMRRRRAKARLAQAHIVALTKFLTVLITGIEINF